VATRWPQAAAFAPAASITLALAAGAFDFFDHQLATLAICLGLSAVLLGALHVAPVSRDERTTLADLVLLTPLALFITEKNLVRFDSIAPYYRWIETFVFGSQRDRG
jgi:hypothetical protein